MKSKFSTIGLIPTLVISSLASVCINPSKSIAQSATANCHFYAVNIKGTVNNNYGNQQFSVNQYAIWRDRGLRSNPIEFMLKTFTDLNVNPQVGQIELLTNSRYAYNAGIASAQIDLAKVSLGNTQTTFTLDSGASLQLPPPNVFVSPGVSSSPGGLGGLGFLTGAGQDLARILNSTYLIPRQGGGSFTFTDTSRATIVGQLDIVGTGVDNMSLQGRYKANFSGNYIGSTTCQ
jgi:hypothetical protein